MSWIHENMTEAELVRYVYAKLIEQGGPSSSNGECLYRGPHGLKCAAGILIPDEFYPKIQHLEGITWQELVSKAGEIPTKHGGLIECLQSSHDAAEYAPDSEWARALAVEMRRHISEDLCDEAGIPQ